MGVIVLAGMCLCQNGMAASDNQLWIHSLISHKEGHHTYSLFPGARYKNDMDDLFYRFVYLGYEYGVSNTTGLITQILVDETKSGEEWVDQTYVIAGFKWSLFQSRLATLTLSDRFFYRLSDEDRWDHHRPRLLMQFKGLLNPYIANEWRFDLKGDRDHTFYKNRIEFGISKPVHKNLSASIGYLCEHNKTRRGWDENHVLKIMLKVLV